MTFFKHASKNTKWLIISSVVTALLLLLSLIGGEYARAWFRDYEDVTNPAMLTNFDIMLQYSFDDGETWTPIAAGKAISLNSVEEAEQLSVRIQYIGHSAAYLRTSVYGNFSNKYTGTYLPQTEDFWSFSIPDDHASSWIRLNDGDYWYYKKRIEKLTQAEFDENIKSTILPYLNVSIDREALGNISDYQDYKGEVYIIVDAVQPDRCDDFWGIESSEFTDAAS